MDWQVAQLQSNLFLRLHHENNIDPSQHPRQLQLVQVYLACDHLDLLGSLLGLGLAHHEILLSRHEEPPREQGEIHHGQHHEQLLEQHLEPPH